MTAEGHLVRDDDSKIKDDLLCKSDKIILFSYIIVILCDSDLDSSHFLNHRPTQ